jgi:hypothetical protein
MFIGLVHDDRFDGRKKAHGGGVDGVAWMAGSRGRRFPPAADKWDTRAARPCRGMEMRIAGEWAGC